MGLTSNRCWRRRLLSGVLPFAGTVWLYRALAGRTWRAVLGRRGCCRHPAGGLRHVGAWWPTSPSGSHGSWADLVRPGDAAARRNVSTTGRDEKPAARLRVVGDRRVGRAVGARPRSAGGSRRYGSSAVRRGSRRLRTCTAAGAASRRGTARVRSRGRRPDRLSGTASALVDKLHYPRTAFDLAEAGRMRPMILMMLRPTVAPPRYTECVDVPGGPQTGVVLRQGPGREAVKAPTTAWTPAGRLGCRRQLDRRLLRPEARHAPSRVYGAGPGSPLLRRSPAIPPRANSPGRQGTEEPGADLWWCLKALARAGRHFTARHQQQVRRDELQGHA